MVVVFYNLTYSVFHTRHDFIVNTLCFTTMKLLFWKWQKQKERERRDYHSNCNALDVSGRVVYVNDIVSYWITVFFCFSFLFFSPRFIHFRYSNCKLLVRLFIWFQPNDFYQRFFFCSSSIIVTSRFCRELRRLCGLYFWIFYKLYSNMNYSTSVSSKHENSNNKKTDETIDKQRQYQRKHAAFKKNKCRIRETIDEKWIKEWKQRKCEYNGLEPLKHTYMCAGI